MNHQRPEAVDAPVENALREYGVAGKRLLVVGIADAYCVGRMGRISCAKLQRQLRRRVDGDRYLSLRASSGTTYVDFARQKKEAVLDIAEISDSLVLLGRWGDAAAPVGYIQTMAIMAADIWTDPCADYSGTSDGGCVYGKFDDPQNKKPKSRTSKWRATMSWVTRSM